MKIIRNVKNNAAIKLIAIFVINTPATVVFSHDVRDGYGVTGSHGHISDVLGFVVLTAVIALTLMLSRGGK